MNNDNYVVEFMNQQADMKCHKCGAKMRKLSWKITAGAHDVAKEVEQYVFECEKDKNTVTIEITTGKASEFAVLASSDFSE